MKDCQELLDSIKKCREKLLRLQHKIESTALTTDDDIPRMKGHRRELKQLRREMETVKQKYIDMGGVYCPTKAERNDEEFEKNIDFISRIDYRIGGFDGRFQKYIEFKDNGQCVIREFEFAEPVILNSATDYIRKSLKNMHIGEWIGRSFYNEHVMDGTQWNVKIMFSNGHEPIEIDGSNAFPYNFEDFDRFFDSVVRKCLFKELLLKKEAKMRLVDRWAREDIGFVWKGTREEFEKEEGLTLIKQNGDLYYYVNSKGTKIEYNESTKVYSFPRERDILGD